MISCLLIHVSRTSQGLPVRQAGVIAGETIQIGRGAACPVHLPDHRVALHHASVRRADDGSLHMDAAGEAMLKIDGIIARSVALQPGMRIEIGPYVLGVETAPAGHDIALSMEKVHAPDGHETAVGLKQPVTLEALGFSKRTLGAVLAVCILLVFLLLPMLPGASQALDKWQADLPVTLNGSWSPGSLTGGHALFEAKCSTCHKRPFQAVADEVCTGCHTQAGKHLSNETLHKRAFGSMRCTDCHADHKSRAKLRHDAEKCVACHGDIKRINPDSKLADVHDFATGHPAFHITLPEGVDADGVERVVRFRQQDKPVERSALKYSHKIHLDKAGISSPEGDTVMQCRDCHRLDASGKHFAAMTMEKTCQQSACHALNFTEPVEGIVPHGSERAVMSRLREFYGRWLADVPENRAQCEAAGAPANSVRATLDCVNDLARRNGAATLFRKNAECGECHEITPVASTNVPWKVTPLRTNHDWQPGAVFPHAKHGAMGCTACHDKMNSEKSADIAMPAIDKCRECHIGKDHARGKLISTCESCHRFHRDERK
ncbi:MAG: cytochrome c3 family protein [Gallionella sp.]|nr:cytochrome c3 family protein [Gallionella sp.]